MMRGCFTGLLGVLLVLSSATTLAQTPQEMELAKKRYQVGEQLYEISQYDKALTEFQEAYRIWPRHDMLFNIARCHEVLANLEEAIKNYKLFLAKRSDSPQVPLVNSRIRSLEDRLKKKKTEMKKATVDKAKEKPEAPPLAKAEVKEEKPATIPTTEYPESSKPGHTWRWTAGWAGVGVGGAALVGGIVFGALASGKSSDFEGQRDSGATYKSLSELRDTGEQYETIGIAMMVSGGVLLASGGMLLILEMIGEEKDTESTNAMFAPVVTQDGIGFSAHMSF